MLKTAIGRLRVIGLTEGVSFLLLLGVAMPLKYLADKPVAVSVVGLMHGLLFIGLCIALLDVRRRCGWKMKPLLVVFVAALVPFGPFVIDGRLKAEDEAWRKSGDQSS